MISLNMNTSSNRLVSGRKILLILLLVVATLLLSNTINRYQDSGAELLVNNNFSNELEGWKKSKNGHVIIDSANSTIEINSENGIGTFSVSQMLEGVIKKGSYVRLSARIKTDGVGTGDKVWEAARIIFIGLDNQNQPMYYVTHALAVLNGTSSWHEFSKIFVSYSNKSKHRVEIQLVNVKGLMRVKDLSLRPVIESLTYKIFWYSDVVLWLFTFVWVLLPHIRRLFDTKQSLLVLIVLMAVLGGVLMPVNIKHSFGQFFSWLYPVLKNEAGFFRLGHFLIFMLLSIIVFLREKPSCVVRERLELLILFALVTETLQLLVDGRSFKIMDIIVDISGISLALILTQLWICRKMTSNIESFRLCLLDRTNTEQINRLN